MAQDDDINVAVPTESFDDRAIARKAKDQRDSAKARTDKTFRDKKIREIVGDPDQDWQRFENKRDNRTYYRIADRGIRSGLSISDASDRADEVAGRSEGRKIQRNLRRVGWRSVGRRN